MEDHEDLIIQQINDIEPPEQNECFVCFEIQKLEEFPICLKNQTLFLKFCSCNGWIHNSCLQEWFNANEKCPICRKIMIYNENINLELGFYIIFYFYYLKFILIKIYNNIIRFRNFFVFYVALINIINIVYFSFDKYNKQNYNYDYDYIDDYCYSSNSLYNEPIENRIVPID